MLPLESTTQPHLSVLKNRPRQKGTRAAAVKYVLVEKSPASFILVNLHSKMATMRFTSSTRPLLSRSLAIVNGSNSISFLILFMSIVHSEIGWEYWCIQSNTTPMKRVNIRYTCGESFFFSCCANYEDPYSVLYSPMDILKRWCLQPSWSWSVRNFVIVTDFIALSISSSRALALFPSDITFSFFCFVFAILILDPNICSFRSRVVGLCFCLFANSYLLTATHGGTNTNLASYCLSFARLLVACGLLLATCYC